MNEKIGAMDYSCTMNGERMHMWFEYSNGWIEREKNEEITTRRLRRREEMVNKMPQNRSINTSAHEGRKCQKRRKKRTQFQKETQKKIESHRNMVQTANTHTHVWKEHQGQHMIKRVKMTNRKTQNNCCFVNTICCCFSCRCCLGVRVFSIICAKESAASEPENACEHIRARVNKH